MLLRCEMSGLYKRYKKVGHPYKLSNILVSHLYADRLKFNEPYTNILVSHLYADRLKSNESYTNILVSHLYVDKLKFNKHCMLLT